MQHGAMKNHRCRTSCLQTLQPMFFPKPLKCRYRLMSQDGLITCPPLIWHAYYCTGIQNIEIASMKSQKMTK